MNVETDTVVGACGMGVIYEFDSSYGHDLDEITPLGGAGYVMAGFIEGNEICDKAFKIMTERWDLVWRSEVRENRNSGNKFYTAVFDCSDGGKARYGFDHADEDNDELS